MADVFDVLVHTKGLLIIQTHAGSLLDDNTDGSNTCFGNFNLGLHVGDNAKQVLANRGCLLARINSYLVNTTSNGSHQRIDVDSLYWLNQTHSNQVVIINDDTSQNSPIENRAIWHQNESSQLSINPLTLTAPSADALVTRKPNTALAVMTADCVPIVIYDAASGYIATIHAGWHGLANGVITQTISALEQQGASNEMQAWIGACISPTCYEVSIEVVDKLLSGCQKRGMNVEAFKSSIVKAHIDPSKAWLNLPTLAAHQLKQHSVAVHKYSNVNKHKVNKYRNENSNNIETVNSSNDSSLKDSHLKDNHLNDSHLKDSHLKDNHLNDSYLDSNTEFAYGCSYSNEKYYSYRRTTHQKQESTGRMAMIAIRLD